MAKNTNIVPGDEEIVTKKGFLISPPKQTRRKNPLSDRIAAERADEQNADKNRQEAHAKQNPHRKNTKENREGGETAQENSQNRENGNREGTGRNNNRNRQGGKRPDRPNKNERFERGDRNERGERAERAEKGEHGNEARANNEVRNGNEGRTGAPDNKNRRGNDRGERGERGERVDRNERGDHRNRNRQKESFGDNAGNNAGTNGAPRGKNDRTGGKFERGERGEKGGKNGGGNNGRDRDNKRRDKKPREKLSVLADLGFNPDNFGRRSGFMTRPEEEVEEVIDYSKAVPLRDQIYPPKPAVETQAEEASEIDERPEIIGVRFKEAGKIYYFDPDGNTIAYGTPVIVETARGMEYGYTAISNRRVPTDDVVLPLKKIVRLATEDDKLRLEANKRLETSAAEVFVEKVQKLKLEMHLVGVEYTFDNTKLLFYFSAEGRVDFRELVKELASVFRTRIELRQVGVRDEAKLLGGLGVCGRPLCCKTFLGEFAQVSIKMAKDQNLSLNSSKISGTCGRLLCCLRYEDEVYRREYERTPRVDAIVETKDGKGIVTEANPLKGIVKVRLQDNADAAPQPYHRDEVRVIGHQPRGNKNEEKAEREIEKELGGE